MKSGIIQYHELGLHHVSLGEYDKAEFYFVRAIQMSPQESVFHHNAGKVCLEQMKIDEAEKHLRQAILLDPNCAAAHCDLSIVLGLQGKWEECFKEYEWRNEYFSDLGFYRDIYSFGCKVFVCKQGIYRSFLMMPKLSDIGKE